MKAKTMTDPDIEQWRASRHTRKPRTVTKAIYTPHADAHIDTLRRIDAAAELIAPVLTDGTLLALVQRTLAAGRLELCGCLDAIAKDTVHTSAFERDFAYALRSYITVRTFQDQAAACIDCHRERCKGGAK